MSIFLSGASITFTPSFTIFFLLDALVATEPCVILHFLACDVCVCEWRRDDDDDDDNNNIIKYEWIYTWWQCGTMQDRTVKYNNTSHTITYSTDGKSQCSKWQKNQEHMLYTVKTQKRVEPKVAEL
jgi:hypothetical protein